MSNFEKINMWGPKDQKTNGFDNVGDGGSVGAPMGSVAIGFGLKSQNFFSFSNLVKISKSKFVFYFKYAFTLFSNFSN